MSKTWQLTTARMAPSQLEQLLEQSVRENEIEAMCGGKFVKSESVPSDYWLREIHGDLQKVMSK